jgi:hypothetical protein
MMASGKPEGTTGTIQIEAAGSEISPSELYAQAYDEMDDDAPSEIITGPTTAPIATKAEIAAEFKELDRFDLLIPEAPTETSP